jgi:hypothetical protein
MSLTDSLISYWKLDEASGNALDAHGSNTLTDNNTVGTAAGKINTARQFTAANSEYLNHADNTDLSTGDIDFTFAAWVYLETTPAAELSYIVISKDNDAGSREYVLDINNPSTPRFYVNGGGGGMLVSWSANLSTGVWYHVVGWHDATANQLGICVNAGTPVTQSTGGTAPNDGTAEFRLGNRSYSGFEGYLDGRIDEVGFWKRVLTSQERTDLYNGGAGLAYPFTGGGGGFKAAWLTGRRSRLLGSGVC